MSTQIFFSFILASSILISTPGPTLLTIMSDSLSHGPQKSLLTISGAILAHIIFISLVAIGMSQLLMMSMDYFLWVKWIGVAYLMGMGILKLITRQETEKAKNQKHGRKRTLFLRGFLATISNPKTILFYAAFFPPFLNPNEPLLNQYIVLGMTFIGTFIIITSSYSLFANQLLNIILKKRQVLLDRISGIMMILAGLILSTIRASR